MATSINLAAYSDAMVVLGTAGVVVPMVHRFGMSPVLGYLAAGALLGPLGLGSFSSDIPALRWVTVVDAHNVAGIADLGVVFLLFLLGLELTYERLMAMRRLVFGLGALQVVITSTLLASILAMVGLKPSAAAVVGACLALSSTAIVLEVLSIQRRMATGVGRASFAVLLAQDLAVIPLLMLVSTLGAQQGSSILSTIGTALFQATAAVAFIVLVGRLLLRPIFRQVARTQSDELFIAAILFVIVGTGLVAGIANLSMALGAFVAGLLLAETEYRKAIEATIDPFKGLLLGIFFFTVGMSIDVRELVREPLLLVASVIGLIAVKSAVLIGLMRRFKQPWPVAIETGLLLGPGGEFAFVGIGLASSLSVVSPSVASVSLAATSLSMALIPALSALAQRLARHYAKPAAPDPVLALKPDAQHHHAIVIGFGRVGRVVCKLMTVHGVAYTVVDHDANTVTQERAKGQAVYFGDATQAAFLRVCGLADASSVVITVHTQSLIDEIVHQVRTIRPDIPIVSRARDARHARHLYAIGVTDAVPETIEASLQLSEAALVSIGVPMGPIIASIHEQRDEFRRDLQSAATAAGRTAIRSIRAKAKKPQS